MKMEKKKVVAKIPKEMTSRPKKKRPFGAMEGEEGAEVEPLRRKFEKRGRDTGTSASLEVIIVTFTIE